MALEVLADQKAAIERMDEKSREMEEKDRLREKELQELNV